MNLYGTLGLERGASTEQVRDAYKGLVKKAHPDRGGDAEKFKQIQKAYEVLSDDGKKAYYDQTGQIPGEDGGGGGGGQGHPFGFGGVGGGIPVDIGNIFNMFGMPPGGIPPGRRKKQGKAPSRITHIPLTLKDYYNGRAFLVQLEKQKFCKDCKGDGSTLMKSCAGCNGSGMKKQIIQMGPFMMENSGPCDMCGGQGKQKGDSCWTCKGSGFTKEEKGLHVRIEPGMAAGNTITFTGESSDTQDYAEAGDVIIELQAADEQSPWERKGDDLHTKVRITYGQSLVGYAVRIASHPGYTGPVVFGIPPGTVNNEVISVKGYGMPKRGTSEKGNAVLTVEVLKPSASEYESLMKARELLINLFQVSAPIKQDGDHFIAN